MSSTTPIGRVALALCLVAVSGCGRRELRELTRASDDAATAVRRGDARALSQQVVVGARSRVDYAAILRDKAERAAWARRLAAPDAVKPAAVVFMAADLPVAAVWTGHAWVFSEDPSLGYDQSTPRGALRSLVRASRNKRWDVLLGLAPERYRLGLAEADLQRAWTEGEHAAALQASRDRLARHLGDPIVGDAHEAILDLGDGDAAHLEREGARWVVVDF